MLAIYMTTHLSFHVGPMLSSGCTAICRDILKQLPFQNAHVNIYNNTGYRSGAIQAMLDPLGENVTWLSSFFTYSRLLRLCDFPYSSRMAAFGSKRLVVPSQNRRKPGHCGTTAESRTSYCHEATTLSVPKMPLSRSAPPIRSHLAKVTTRIYTSERCQPQPSRDAFSSAWASPLSFFW
jgi:hypothetical protein